MKKKHFPTEPLKIPEENKIFKKRLNKKNYLRNWEGQFIST